MLKVSSVAQMELDEEYDLFEKRIADRVAEVSAKPLFTTDVDPGDLWMFYLLGIDKDRRQHYNCRCCERFFRNYANLVTINDDGAAVSAIWDGLEAPPFFQKSVASVQTHMKRAKVNGVFLSADKTWGTPKTGDWTHLAGNNARVHKDKLKTAFQASAEKLEEFKMLSHGLRDYPQATIEQAVRILEADAVYRSEKALGIAKWFLNVSQSSHCKHGPRKDNLIWKAVASAPPGFCHVRSTMISTLLDDLIAGMDFDAVAKRWAGKMHPLQYQRPTAPPTSGQIDAAEKIAEKLGIIPSLRRRFATLDDVLAKLWVPAPPKEEVKPEGAFGHLRPTTESTTKTIDLPAVTMTFEKFRRTVLPTASSIEIKVPTSGPFYGLLTAAVPETPAIYQWDGLEGHARNPVSHYFYITGSLASSWGLASGFTKVSAIFLSPHEWQEPDKFKHHKSHVFFAIDGCKDKREGGLAIFPEDLRSELHGVRSVIEAHSRTGKLEGRETASANGLAMTQGTTLRVKTNGGWATYYLDRID